MVVLGKYLKGHKYSGCQNKVPARKTGVPCPGLADLCTELYQDGLCWFLICTKWLCCVMAAEVPKTWLQRLKSLCY